MGEITGPSDATEVGDATELGDTPPASQGRPAAPSRDGDLTQLERGEHVGRYMILDRLGVGGMGVVYAAYDADLDRKIAVKLLLTGPEAIASATAGHGRMLREAQAMAKLSHRNVIAVHDVGTHRGSVFVAMEFVDGGTMREWMDEGPHPYRPVLERFIAAGRGLAAAHDAGLVHRDFKPANVLLGRDGRVRVADFGLARRTATDRPALASPSIPARSELTAKASSGDSSDALETRGDTLSLRLTRTGAQVGTPAYMALEQYAGAEVDARADQFAFCVALYEALYGERPFAGANLHAIMFQVSQAAVREPSKAAKVPRFVYRALVRGLAAKADDRWPDMPSLLRELQRDPAARWRRLGLVTLIGGALASLAAIALHDEPEPEPAPVCAGVEQAFAETWTVEQRAAIEARVTELGDAWTAGALAHTIPRIDAWADAWRVAWSDACQATRVRGEQSEELLDRRMVCLERRRSRTAKFIGELAHASDAMIERAPQLLEEVGELTSCADAETLMAVVPLPSDPELRAVIADLQAEIDGIFARVLAGEYRGAADTLAAIEARAEATHFRPLLMDLRWIRGVVYRHTKTAEAAEAQLMLALADALAIADDRSAARIIRSMTEAILESTGREHEALRWLALGRALVDRVGGEALQLGKLEATRSRALRGLGELEQAMLAAEAAAGLYAEAKGPNHPMVGDALSSQAAALYKLGRFDEAQVVFERMQSLWASETSPDHPRARTALTGLGALAQQRGDFEAAERYFAEALASTSRVRGPDHAATATARSNHAVMLLELGRASEAAAGFEAALAIREASDGPEDPYVGHTHANLALARSQADDHEGALASAERALAILIAARGPDHVELATAHAIRGIVLRERGELDRAHADFRRTLELILANYGSKHADLFEAYFHLADVEHRRGHARVALDWLEQTEALPLGDRPNRRREAQRELLFAQLHAATGRDRADALARARRARTLLAEHGELPELTLEQVDAVIVVLDQ